VWMKAVIQADQGNTAEVEKEFQRLIVLDPEVQTTADAETWMELLMEDLRGLREQG
jgi:hypothetical protein